MRTGQTYHTREIETMLRSKQGQAKLRSTLEQTRLLPIDFLGEDGAPGSSQQILEQVKNQARQEAAEILAAKGVSARVIDMHTIKPIDTEILVKAAKETGFIVTVEEHNITGGLGGAVCEALSQNYPCRVKLIGVEEKFGKSGTPAALLEKYGLTAEAIAEKILLAKEEK